VQLTNQGSSTLQFVLRNPHGNDAKEKACHRIGVWRVQGGFRASQSELSWLRTHVATSQIGATSAEANSVPELWLVVWPQAEQIPKLPTAVRTMCDKKGKCDCLGTRQKWTTPGLLIAHSGGFNSCCFLALPAAECSGAVSRLPAFWLGTQNSQDPC
jgi:hypothetical protein